MSEATDKIHALIQEETELWELNIVHEFWEERMKALGAERLKPGSDEPIEDMHALDYIWSLGGDRSISGDQVYHPRAIDYYLGRTVCHVWGDGKLVRFIRSDEEMVPRDREHFGDALVVSDVLRDRGYKYGIALKYPCTCGKVEYDMFAIPGAVLPI